MSRLLAVGFSVAEHRPKDVDPPSGERDHGLVVAFALGPLPPVEGLAAPMVVYIAEGGAVQESLQDPVAAPRPPLVAPRAGCPQDRGELPAAAANESAEANREESPTSATAMSIKLDPYAIIGG